MSPHQLLHLLRMAKWARNPPSARRVKLVLAVLLAVLALFAVERLIGWPERLNLQETPRGRIGR